jgi:hypothetical protein
MKPGSVFSKPSAVPALKLAHNWAARSAYELSQKLQQAEK